MHNSLVIQASHLIEQRTGLAVLAQFRHDLEPLLMQLAHGSLDTYIRQLRGSAETDPIWQQLIHTLTIGETYFFRDMPHFRLLRERILPPLILKRRQQKRQQINIWSAGCASGEEAYSIAITMREFLPDLPQWTLRLLGSDLNAHALRSAERGVYRKWSFRHSDDKMRLRYFTPLENSWQIKSEIRQMVTFRHANLMNGAPLPQLDVIFLRNVLIYLDEAHIRKLETIMFESLAPGGWMLLGQAEAIHFQRERWLTHIFPGAVIYQKPEAYIARPIERHEQPEIEVKPAAAQPMEDTPVVGYVDAVLAVQQDDGAKAERVLAELLTKEPGHALGHTLLASIFASRHALPEAQTHLDLALRLDPLLADAHYLRGVLLIEEGQTTEAAKALQAALYCKREHPLALFMLGNLHAQAGELSRAHRYWEKAQVAISQCHPETAVSDLSDLNVGGLNALLGSHLDSNPA